MVIRWLSRIGSSDLDVRLLGMALTECVQRCWLLEACEKKKDGKKRKKGRKEARAWTKQNGKGLRDRKKERTAAE